MYIVAVASVIDRVVTSERSAHDAAQAIAESVGSPIAALLLINIFLLVVGTVIEGLPALLITASILHPVVMEIGIDPVHFGVVITFNLILGILTPPMGIGLFVASRVAGIPVEQVLRATIPSLILFMVSLIVITVFPGLSLWLPELVFGPRPCPRAGRNRALILHGINPNCGDTSCPPNPDPPLTSRASSRRCPHL